MLRRSAIRGRQGEMSMLNTSSGRSSLVQATGVAVLLALAASGTLQLAWGQVIEAQVGERPSPLSRMRPDSTVNKLLDGLEEEAAVNRFKDSWAWRIKGLI